MSLRYRAGLGFKVILCNVAPFFAGLFCTSTLARGQCFGAHRGDPSCSKLRLAESLHPKPLDHKDVPVAVPVVTVVVVIVLSVSAILT